jgi:hypothetical protein
MSEPIHEFPEAIELTRDEYRAQHAALEATLDLIDRFPDADPDGSVRRHAEAALRILLRRIWPFLDDLDDDG